MIDCTIIAEEILSKLKGKNGGLAVLSIGENVASKSYIKGKRLDCEKVGFKFNEYHYEDGANEDEIVSTIYKLNEDDTITGIIVQLPIPAHYNKERIINSIDKSKDVDGFLKDSPFLPCTPEAIIYIIEKIFENTKGLEVLLIGRGELVGKPLLPLLIERDMTVTVCHSHTRDLYKHFSRNPDVVISAVGKPNFITKEKVNYSLIDSLVIDCGVNRGVDGKLCGDVEPGVSYWQTPVPRGLGLLTRAMLMKHIAR